MKLVSPVSSSCPHEPSLCSLKTFLMAACLVLATWEIYQVSRMSMTFNSMPPLNWLAEINFSQPRKVDTTGSASLNNVTVISGTEVAHAAWLEKDVKFSLTGTTSRRDDVHVLDLDAQFQTVNDKNIWVFSAHYEGFNDKAPVLRILGIGKKEMNHVGIYCHVTEQGKTIIVQGKQENIKGGSDKIDVPSIFSCVLKEKSKPSSVSLTFNMTNVLTNRIRVVYPEPLKRNFTVCHAALFNFNKPKQIINSFEINRIFGAQHFYVYNHSVSNTTDAVLRHYQKLGLLTVMPWPLPATDAWYHGQLLAINDCMYRNRGVSKFVVIHDTDEYIIPEVHNSWAEVLRAAEDDYFKDETKTRNIKIVSSFLFQNSFYYNSSSELWKYIKRNYSMTADEEEFLTKNAVFPFLHTLKDDFIYKFPTRSKTIARPEYVISSGIHQINVHRDSAGQVFVNRSLAGLHHYRRGPLTNITETSALRFMKIALPALRAAYNSLVSVLAPNVTVKV